MISMEDTCCLVIRFHIGGATFSIREPHSNWCLQIQHVCFCNTNKATQSEEEECIQVILVDRMECSSTSIPTILIFNQKFSIWSEGSIFRECSHSQRRTTRSWIRHELAYSFKDSSGKLKQCYETKDCILLVLIIIIIIIFIQSFEKF